MQGETGPVVYTLKSADTPYRLLVEQMREGALTVSAEGVILYANAAFAHGGTSHRTPPRHEANGIGRRLHMTHVLAAQGGLDVRLRTSRGELRDTYFSSAPLTLDDAEVQCVIVIDLTRQELRRRHEAIVNSLADAILQFELGRQAHDLERSRRAALAGTRHKMSSAVRWTSCFRRKNPELTFHRHAYSGQSGHSGMKPCKLPSPGNASR